MNTVAALRSIPTRFSHTFSALQYPNFRLWFMGQTVSLFGTWMQNTAQGYLVYELTGSSAYLGYVGFAAGLPSLMMLNMVGGVIADRVSRRKMIIATQSVMMCLAFILAALVFTDMVRPWQIILLAFFLGIANSFDAPARLAFVVEMVERKDLTNAIALNATMFNLGTVFGPAIAGLTYAAVGPGWCFTINGLTYLAVIAALLLMRFEPVAKPLHRARVIVELVDGFKYTFSEGVVRVIVINMAVVSLFGISLLTLMPAWAVEVLGGDVRTNGLLMSARGLGALVAALTLAALSHSAVRGKLWTIGSFLLPFSMLLFAQIRWIPTSLLVIAFTGWSFITLANGSNAMIQNRISDEMRGRVMGIYSLVFFGTMPLGSILAGQSATYLGLPQTFIAGALVCLAAALLVLLRFPTIRKLS